MTILKIFLIIITAVLIIMNGLTEYEDYKERFVVNGLLLLYLIYILFN